MDPILFAPTNDASVNSPAHTSCYMHFGDRAARTSYSKQSNPVVWWEKNNLVFLAKDGVFSWEEKEYHMFPSKYKAPVSASTTQCATLPPFQEGTVPGTEGTGDAGGQEQNVCRRRTSKCWETRTEQQLLLLPFTVQWGYWKLPRSWKTNQKHSIESCQA